MRRTAAALAALALAAAGCTTSTTTVLRPAPSATEADHGNSEGAKALPGGVSCGVERWAVKTGTDSSVGQVDTTHPVATTIAALDAIPAPPSLPPYSRVAPTEDTVFTVHATLRGFKQEADSDYHLVLTDGPATMIAEIPDPPCVGAGSPFAKAIAAARAAFDARFAPFAPSTSGFTTAGVPVTVTGVGFFDTLHGQTGVAPNGIELHPVLRITFGVFPSPSPS